MVVNNNRLGASITTAKSTITNPLVVMMKKKKDKTTITSHLKERELEELQRNTLIRIFSVCPKPSALVINMICAEMNLSRRLVLDFFVEMHGKSVR